jgi:hypothetical protein
MRFLTNERARKLLDDYNQSERCLRYNKVADAVYKARERIGDPLAAAFERYIVDGLKGFEMARTMRDGFDGRLHYCLDVHRAGNLMIEFTGSRLSSIDLDKVAPRFGPPITASLPAVL